MSTPARARGEWAGRGSGLPALRQLESAVQQLRRARWIQTVVEHVASGLCVALFAAAGAVLAIRLGVLGWRLDLAIGGALLAGLGVSLVLAWRHRPDDLAVAIDADLRLNLKQQMSTAWEVAREQGDVELSRRLARQAVHARLPGRSATVFPLRVNGLGLAAPVALILLVLVSIVDLDGPRGEAGAAVDESVIQEGLRLREYGLRMEARARRDDLGRSEAQARNLQQLGDRMHAGTLSRDRALERLRDLGRELDAERLAALESGAGIEVGPLSTRPMTGSPPGAGAPGAADMLRRLREGDLSAGDLEALANGNAALQGSGVSREDLERALRELESGDGSALEDVLDRMARGERQRAGRDAEELRRARERITRARENLGDATARPADDDPASPGAAQAGTPLAGAPQASLPDGGGEEDSGGGSLPGLPDGQASRPTPRNPTPTASTGPTLEADPRLGKDGDVFVSRARALPRAGEVTTPERELDARFRPLMEEVLASEHYPAHYKEYIRRYFLGLSEGARREEPTR